MSLNGVLSGPRKFAAPAFESCAGVLLLPCAEKAGTHFARPRRGLLVFVDDVEDGSALIGRRSPASSHAVPGSHQGTGFENQRNDASGGQVVRVSCAACQRPSWGGKVAIICSEVVQPLPYHSKMLGLFEGNLHHPSKKEFGTGSDAKRAIDVEGQIDAFSSMWAIACSRAMRPFSEPSERRLT